MRLGLVSDALCALEEMRQSKQLPKLGALQRWVRECDAAGDDDSEALLLLDSILRTADPAQVGLMDCRADGKAEDHGRILKCGGRVRLQEAWDAFDRPTAPLGPDEVGLTMQHAQTAASLTAATQIRRGFKSCLREVASQRKPPNIHDLTIHTSEPGAITLDPVHSTVRRYEVPFVPNTFLVADLLTRDESCAIIAAGEAVGYDPDEKARGTSAAKKKSVLAHAFVWCTDAAFIDTLWQRLEGAVPRRARGQTSCWP